jgi:hypothetical protein
MALPQQARRLRHNEGDSLMKRMWTLAAAAAIAVALFTGCSKKADEAATTSADSLLSPSPVEQPQGNLTPQTAYQAPQTQAPPTTTPKSKPKSSGGGSAPSSTPRAPANPGVTIPEGTGVSISVDAQLSSETAHEGDTWTGTVKEPVVIGSAAPIPAGSTVTGVISGVHPAQKGTRAYLVLAITSVNANGQTVALHATADSIIAGSTRTRNIGSIAGGAAAGAIIGKAVGGGGKGAIIGGLLGAGAATGAVAASKGYQATLKEGSVLVFHVDRSVTIRT